MEARNLDNEYVPQNIFDLHLQNIRERAISDRELNDERFAKFQAILEKNLSEYKNIIIETNAIRKEMSEMKSELKNEITEIKGKIDLLNKKVDNNRAYFEEKIEHVTDTLAVAINGLNTRIYYLNQTYSRWFFVLSVWLAAVPIAVVVIQSFIGK